MSTKKFFAILGAIVGFLVLVFTVIPIMCALL